MRIRFSVITAILLALASSLSPLAAQQLNLGFENLDPSDRVPQSLRPWGKGFTLAVDSVVRHAGKYSIRMEPSPGATLTDFGSWVFTLPAKYEGSTIELRGYMKYQDISKGFVGLIMRIDGESGMLRFDNMQQRGLRGTADWQEYSIKLPLVKEAKTIFFGAIFQGKGTLWVDDLELLIDGKNYTEAKPRQEQLYKADQDKEFDGGSGITSVDLHSQTIENLTTLAKVWGFLKYYHPNIASGDHQWDYELFRTMRDILKVREKRDRNEILLRWIRKLGSFPTQGELQFPDSARVKMYPDLAWADDAAELGQDLVNQLHSVEEAKREMENYYIGLTPSVGNPLFRNEKLYASMPYPDAGYRLLSLFRYWNMIQYYFPYKYLIGEDWNGVLREFVPKFVAAKDEPQYKLVLLELITRVHDTHANIWQPDKALTAFKGRNFAPFVVRFVEGKAVVIDYINNDLAQEASLKKGDIVLSINGLPVEEFVKSRLPYTPASNYPTQLRIIASDLLRSNDSVVSVRYERNGAVSDANVGCYAPEKLNFAAYQRRDTCGKFVANDVGYIYPGTIKNEYLPAMMLGFSHTKGIVIDMRCYPSDFIVFTLSHYLMPEVKPFVQFTRGDMLAPGLFTFGPKLSAGGGEGNFYEGTIVVLVNETTISQAEYTAMAFRAAPHTIILGSTTCGADGNVSTINLPGGVTTLISGIGVYYPDGRETQRVGIVPDIEVKPTIKGIRENRDELLEKAIEIIQSAK